nr:hypothetical protein BaRGS_015470 [Batillaria attramentaria]
MMMEMRIMEKQESCCKRAKSYARHYTNHSQIPMVVMPTDSNPAPLTFVQTLLEVPVSKDSNAEVLVSKHKCHVVTTANVISLLLNNHPPDFSLAWDIPVIIRQHEGSAFGKVVFLDKPLLPEGLSPSEKKTYYLQKELRTSMCQPLQQGKKTAQKGTDKVKPGLSTETSQQTNASRQLSTNQFGRGLVVSFDPNSSLIRVRVNMGNHEIAYLEELQLNQILQPTLSFSVPAAFTLLKNIFTKLTEGGYDLHFHHMGFSMTERRDKTVPWVPVDPTLILPLHWRLGLVPATFQPADYDANRKKQMRDFETKKKKKKQKKGKNYKQ